MADCEGDVCVLDKKNVTFGSDKVLEFDKDEPVADMCKKEKEVEKSEGGISWVVVLIFIVILIIVIVVISRSSKPVVVAAVSDAE